MYQLAWSLTYPFSSSVPDYKSIAGTYGEYRPSNSTVARYHLGTDIIACGQPVRAAESGTAIYHSFNTENGYWVEINNRYKYLHLAPHDPNIARDVEIPVSEGDIIGTSSNTGGAGFCHLHFDKAGENILNIFQVPDTVNGEIGTIFLRQGAAITEIVNGQSYNLSGNAEVIVRANDLSNINRRVNWSRIRSILDITSVLQDFQFNLLSGIPANATDVYSTDNPASTFSPFVTWYRMGTLNLTEGSRQICIEGYDINNTASRLSQQACKTFTIDRTPPQVSGLNMTPNPAGNDPPAIHASVTDALSQIVAAEYFIDNDPGERYGNPMNVSANSPGQPLAIGASVNVSGLTGSHTIYVRAEDAAGNWTRPPIAAIFSVDHTQPGPANITPSSNGYDFTADAGNDPDFDSMILTDDFGGVQLSFTPVHLFHPLRGTYQLKVCKKNRNCSIQTVNMPESNNAGNFPSPSLSSQTAQSYMPVHSISGTGEVVASLHYTVAKVINQTTSDYTTNPQYSPGTTCGGGSASFILSVSGSPDGGWQGADNLAGIVKQTIVASAPPADWCKNSGGYSGSQTVIYDYPFADYGLAFAKLDVNVQDAYGDYCCFGGGVHDQFRVGITTADFGVSVGANAPSIIVAVGSSTVNGLNEIEMSAPRRMIVGLINSFINPTLVNLFRIAAEEMGLQQVSNFFNITPSGARFNPPARLTIHFPLANGVSNIQLYVFNELTNRWEVVQDQATNYAGRTVTANIAHTSFYALFGQPDTTPPIGNLRIGGFPGPSPKNGDPVNLTLNSSKPLQSAQINYTLPGNPTTSVPLVTSDSITWTGGFTVNATMDGVASFSFVGVDFANNVSTSLAQGGTFFVTVPPSTITDLSVSNVASNSVTLRWTAPGDDGTVGTATSYDLRFATFAQADSNFSSANQAGGLSAPKISGSAESFTVTGLNFDTTYYFAIKAIDDVGAISQISNITTATILTSTRIWVGADSGSWNDPNNWSPASVPAMVNNVIIDKNLTVNATSSISFNNLTIGDISGIFASTLVVSGLINAGTNVTIYTRSTLQQATSQQLEIAGNFFMDHGSKLTHTINISPPMTVAVNLKVLRDMIINSGASINTDLKGYRGGIGAGGSGQGSGGGQGSLGAYSGAGGGYGGQGGQGFGGARWFPTPVGGTTYGLNSNPAEVGSGGGGGPGTDMTNIGAGGGLVILTVNGMLTVDGTISANAGSTEFAGGQGSGGGIKISASTLIGNGSILANGGDVIGSPYSGAGGGGRIAIFAMQSNFSGLILANGGTNIDVGGLRNGQPGSIFQPDMTPPQINFSTPVSGTILSTNSLNVLVTYFDAVPGVNKSSFHIFIDSNDITSAFSVMAGSATGLVSGVSEGTHTLTAFVMDAASNSATANSLITVDTSPPIVLVRQVSQDGINFFSTSTLLQTTNNIFAEIAVQDVVSGLDITSGSYVVRLTVDGCHTSNPLQSSNVTITATATNKDPYFIKASGLNLSSSSIMNRIEFALKDKAGNTITTVFTIKTSENANSQNSYACDDAQIGNKIAGTVIYPTGGITRIATLSNLANAIAPVIDTDNGFAYFGLGNGIPSSVVKIDLNNFTNVGSLVNSGGALYHAAVIDKKNGFAYFGTDASLYGLLGKIQGQIIKVRLSDFSVAGTITLNSTDNALSAAVIDTDNGFAYFVVKTDPGKILKIRLSDFSIADTLVLSKSFPASVAIDTKQGFAYVGTDAQTGEILKIRLSDFQHVGTLVLPCCNPVAERNLTTAVIDPDGGFIYFGLSSSAKVIKVRLSDFSRIDAMVLDPIVGEGVGAATIDSQSGFAYFGVNGRGPDVSKIFKLRLSDFSIVGSLDTSSFAGFYESAIIDSSAGNVYFGSLAPGVVTKFAVTQKGFVKGTKIVLSDTAPIVKSLSFYSHIATGNVKLAIYDDRKTKLWESPTIPVSVSNGFQTINISTGSPSVIKNLPQGAYWLAWQYDSIASMPSFSMGNLGDGFYLPQNFSSFPNTISNETLTFEKWSIFANITSNVAPSSPTILSPSDNVFLNFAPTLTWNVPIDFDNDKLHFKVEVSTDPNFLNGDNVFNSNINVSGFNPSPPVNQGTGTVSFQIPRSLLTDNNTYYWRVSAFDGIDFSPVSNSRSFSVDFTSPTVISAKTKSTTNIELVFSEEINAGSIVTSNFSVSRSSIISVAKTGPATVSLTVSTMSTDATPSIGIGSISDLAGNILTSTTVVATDGIPPVLAVSVSTAGYPARAGIQIPVTVFASEPLRGPPTVQITQSGQSGSSFIVMTSSNNKNWSGTYSAVAGFDGTATIIATGTDQAGLTSSISNSFVVDATSPAISNLNISPIIFSPDGNGITGDKPKDVTNIAYTLSDNLSPNISSLTLTVFNSSTSLIRTIVSNAQKPLGSNSDIWDGVNSSGTVVPEGNYKIELKAFDLAGNFSIASGTVTVNYPPALSISAVPFTAKTNDTVTVTIYSNKNLISIPSVSMIDSSSNPVSFSSASISGNSYSYTVRVTSAISEGLVVITSSGTDIMGFSGTSTGAFAVNNIADIRNISNAPNPFSPNNDFVNDSSTVTYELTTNALVTINLLNSSGTIVRHLLASVSEGTGIHSHSWDGRDDAGSTLQNGDYSYEVTSNAGGSITKLTTTVTLQNPLLAITNPNFFVDGVSNNIFSPDGDGIADTIAIQYTLSESATASINILGPDKSTVVRHLVANVVKASGTLTEVWNGIQDNGLIAPNDQYYAQIIGTTFGNTMQTNPAVLKVQSANVLVISNESVNPSPFSPDGDGVNDISTISYTLSDTRGSATAVITINIYSDISGTQLVRKLVSNLIENINGTVKSHSWDGKNDNGLIVTNGDYYYQIVGSDSFGFTSKTTLNVQHKISVQTAVLTIINDMASPSSFSPDGDGIADVTSISYKINDALSTGPATVNVKIFSDVELVPSLVESG